MSTTRFLRGLKRTRTAVAAFAELCLTARPSDPIERIANIRLFFEFTNFLLATLLRIGLLRLILHNHHFICRGGL